MGCTGCSTGGSGGQPRGCKNNGTCGTDGCNKVTVFDWLENMTLPANIMPFDGIEVRFKNGRKHFYKANSEFTVSIGDVVVTEAEAGFDVGVVTLTGELVRVQMQKKGEDLNTDKLPKILSKANQEQIDFWQSLREKEAEIQKRSREIAMHLNLKMKISDVEYQGDGTKAIFYYTAEGRVDFRQLIKDLARAFQTRIEMKQIGFRQEAARLGGIGSCGRELCCSTWLTDFRSVSTAAARYQQLALNPQKLAGQCGKLKCCLNFELDLYVESLNKFPRTDSKIKTSKGIAVCQKLDVFSELMWFSYLENPAVWFEIDIDRVHEMLAINKAGKEVEAIEEFANLNTAEAKTSFSSDGSQDSITRFDEKKPSRNSSSRRRRGGRRQKKQAKAPANNTNQKPRSKRPRGPRRQNPNQGNNA